MEFDPYAAWLGIPPDKRPLTHYDVLGLEPFEPDPEKIEQAALRRISRVRQYQVGPRGDLAQDVLARLARARLVLIDPDRRAEYDQGLRDRGVRGPSPEPRPEGNRGSTPPGPAPAAGGAPSVFESLDLRDGGGLRGDSRGRGSRWVLPIWQVRLVRLAIFVLFNAVLLGAFLYGPGNWRRFLPRGLAPPPAQVASAESPASPTAAPVLSPPGLNRSATSRQDKKRKTATPRPGPSGPDGLSARRDGVGPNTGKADMERLPIPVPDPSEISATAGTNAPKYAPDRTHEGILRGKKLALKDGSYVHESEAEADEKLAEVQSAYRQFQATGAEWEKIQAHLKVITAKQFQLKEAQDRINAARNHISRLDAKMREGLGNSADRDELAMSNAVLTDAQAAESAINFDLGSLRLETPPPWQVEAAKRAHEAAAAALRRSVVDLRTVVNAVEATYETLRKDPEVIGAMPRATLVASKPFRDIVANLVRFEVQLGLRRAVPATAKKRK